VSTVAVIAAIGLAGAAPAQPVVTIATAHAVHLLPGAGSRVVGRVEMTTPLTGVRTVLPVLATTPRGWLRVALPGRPNGSSGWIRSGGTRSGDTPWRIRIDIARRRLVVSRLGEVARTFRAIVGAPATPTPTGLFYVEEVVRLDGTAVGGPYALALSARSTVLQEFAGGPGQIAVHGRSRLGGDLGTAASHGCVRLADDAMRWLAGRIGPGTPIEIRP
jgi:lipoprotein-anchoring transpeptidase ErfK/SrfK